MSALTDRFEDTHPHRWSWRIGYVVTASALLIGAIKVFVWGVSQ